MLFKCKVLISLFMFIAKNIFSGFNQSIKERKTTMQVSKVSFVNFSAGKKITPKDVKKAVNPMEEFVHNEKISSKVRKRTSNCFRTLLIQKRRRL